MKRQFKPNNKVKQIENKAKRYLSIGKWHEQRYECAQAEIKDLRKHMKSAGKAWSEIYSDFEERIKNTENELEITKDAANVWNGLYCEQKEKTERWQNKYLDLNVELRKQKLANYDLETNLEEQAVRFNKHEEAYLKELGELEKENKRTSNWLLAIAGISLIYVAIDIIGSLVG